MVTKALYAFFNTHEDAKEAMRELRQRGFVASIEKVDQGLPNPQMDVSSLMVGFLPSLSHALFQSRAEDEREGAYLFVGMEEGQNQDEVIQVIDNFDGEYLEQN